MHLKPHGNRIITKQIERKSMTESGLHIPDKAKDIPVEAEVVAVGPGKTLDNGTVVPIDIKHGDKIVHGRYKGTEIEIHGEEFLILDADNVIAVYEAAET